MRTWVLERKNGNIADCEWGLTLDKLAAANKADDFCWMASLGISIGELDIPVEQRKKFGRHMLRWSRVAIPAA